MKKSLVVLLIGILTLTGVAQAAFEDVDVQTAPFSTSVEVGIASKYVGERSGQVYTDGPVEQSEVAVSTPWFDVSVWNSVSLDRRSEETDGDEIDYTISRSDSLFLGKDIGEVSVEYGVSYYDFAKLCRGNVGNTVAYFGELSRKIQSLEEIFSGKGVGVDGYVRWEMDIPTAGSDFEGGTYTTLGVHGVVREGEPISGLTDISLTRDDGVYGLDPDWIFTYKLSVEIIQGDWTFSPSFTLTTPFHGSSETVFGLSASTEF